MRAEGAPNVIIRFQLTSPLRGLADAARPLWRRLQLGAQRGVLGFEGGNLCTGIVKLFRVWRHAP